jgi:hypothetical protein
MVRGLEKFREYFEGFEDNYVIIGGTACDILLSGQGLTPRATKDIDIILVIEELTGKFVARLWEFLKTGEYGSLQKDSKERKYYRFTKPAKSDFPQQIELFSRRPDSIDVGSDNRFIHISVEEGISSLSAILMNDAYYSYTIEHSSLVEGLHVANIEALVCLKARAFTDLEVRKREGHPVDEYDIKKHKTDIFRMAAVLPEKEKFVLADSIRSDMVAFADRVHGNLPDASILRQTGLPNMKMQELFEQLRRNFGIES